jgi:uncharacterized protein YhfF
VSALWARYRASRPDGGTVQYYEAFRFGNSERLANELADLVARGLKTATSGLLWEYQATGKRFIRAGDLSIVTTWSNEAVCIIETTEVWVVPFCEVGARFAYDYGEGDRSLGWWRAHLWAYYADECAALGRQAAEDMPLVCERFRVVFHP